MFLLDRVLGFFEASLRPGNGGQKVLREARLAAGVLEHEKTRSVGVLDGAVRETALRERRRLLVADDA